MEPAQVIILILCMIPTGRLGVTQTHGWRKRFQSEASFHGGEAELGRTEATKNR